MLVHNGSTSRSPPFPHKKKKKDSKESYWKFFLTFCYSKCFYQGFKYSFSNDNFMVARLNLFYYSIAIENHEIGGAACVTCLVITLLLRYLWPIYGLFYVTLFGAYLFDFFIRLDPPSHVPTLIFGSSETIYLWRTTSEFMFIYLFYEYFLIGELFFN